MQKKILFVPSFAAASFFPAPGASAGLEQGAAPRSRRESRTGPHRGDSGSFGGTQRDVLLWHRGVFKWESQVRCDA